MKVDHEENQAEKLQQLFAEVTNQQREEETKQKENETDKTATNYIEVDVLSLPPRSVVHQRPKRKLYIRLKSPFSRLLFVSVLLLIIIGIIYYLAGDQIMFFFT